MVRELVSMAVPEDVPCRAVHACCSAQRCTVATAMKWSLDNEPGAVNDLEKRWRACSISADVAPSVAAGRGTGTPEMKTCEV